MYLCLGVRAWGDIIMTDSENWKERRNQVARYRAMEQETTDPLAARLLHDIVLDLEAELEGLATIFTSESGSSRGLVMRV